MIADEPVFPTMAEINGVEVLGSDGMTKREWYATHAMQALIQGLLAHVNEIAYPGINVASIVGKSFEYAEAMLKESEKTKQ